MIYRFLMLNIQKDRHNYGKLLAPPINFELTKAIGTTFSLDLYALLAIPVSLFYSKSMEGDFHLNRYDVLDAIRKSKDVVDIFCQKGEIKVPKEYNHLFAFMEDCVEEIQPEILDASFHPKIWVLRFERKDEVIYRLIVLSRNLTFDRSWDVVFFTEGSPLNDTNSSSVKLSDFLKSLYEKSNRKISKAFLKELSKVEFDLPDKFFDFETYPILPFSKKGKEFSNPLLSKSYKDLLIISPFVDVTTINFFKENNKNITILSRQEELDKIPEKILENIDVFCMNDLVANGESYIDTAGDEPKTQNLHAKIFIGENDHVADWYMGSANSTSPAFGRNTEFLIKVSASDFNYRLTKAKRDLFEDGNDYFIPYKRAEIVIDKEKESISSNIRDIIYRLCELDFNASVSQSQTNDNYCIAFDVNLINFEFSGFDITVKVPSRIKENETVIGQNNSIRIDNIAITNLSRYLIFTIYYKKEYQKGILIKMDLEIPDEREDYIFNSLINSKDKFYQYLQFLLSPQDLRNKLQIDIGNNSDNDNSEINKLENIFGLNNPIYEALMIAASRDKKKLLEIDKVIKKLEQIDKEVIKDFMPIWTVFKEFAND